MPEARLDPLTGRWVILAPGRALRPQTGDARWAPGRVGGPPGPGPVGARGHAAPPPDCAFCPGNEHMTPPEAARTGPGAPGTPGWRVRAFPNRFPLVGDGGAAAGRAGAEPVEGEHPLRARTAARGAHEVVVLSPDHHRSLGRLDVDQAVEVLTVLRDRARRHAGAGRALTQVFVNHGSEGGASLVHPHAQVVALDLPSRAVLEEAGRMGAGGRCLLCTEIADQAEDPSLGVAATGAPMWCPWWSRAAFEMLLAPSVHRPRFDDTGPELPDVAAALVDGLSRLDRALGDPPYNLVVHTRPATVTADYHWHVHVWPRLQRDAGFELGTGVQVNLVDPAEAATRLRGA